MKCPAYLWDFGYYGPGSVAWKVNREWAVLLGGTRAVLLQLAHPLVAAGVSNHSSYMTDPLGRAERTFTLGEKLTFGSTTLARHSARTINNLHKQVHGDLSVAAGRFARGTSYNARDPELLLWVHATLVDTLLLSYHQFVGPLTHAEEEQYYQESKAVAHLLGLHPSLMPAGIDELRQYVHNMVQSDQLALTPQAQQLAQQTLFPKGHSALRPLLQFNFLITNALLPSTVREIYGFSWNRHRQQTFELSARSLRLVVPRLPRVMRELPITRKLMRGERKRDA
jgi:uncharacterized protein (DUF2236 family)